MTQPNPVRASFQGYMGGLLAGALGFGGFPGSGTLAVVGYVVTRTAMVGAAILFGIDQYVDIGIKNQALEAAKFDAQSTLSINQVTTAQAIEKMAAGQIINGPDGKPVAGKSLEALTAYLAAQGKAQKELAEGAAAAFDAQNTLSVNDITSAKAARMLAAGVIIKDKNGNPVMGKSLDAFTAYLSAQGKAAGDISEGEAKYRYTIYNIRLTSWMSCRTAVIAIAGPTNQFDAWMNKLCGQAPEIPYKE